MAIPVFPDSITLQEGFEREPQGPFVRTEMDGGMARTRRRFRVFPVEIPVTFLLTPEQYDEYIDFCENTINGYADWFIARLAGQGGIKQKRCRWLLPVPKETPLGGGHWKVVGRLETMSNF